MITGYWSGAKGHKGESDHTAGIKDSLDDASDDGSDVNAAAPPHHLVDGHELAEDGDKSLGSRCEQSKDVSDGGRKLDIQHDADSSDSESAGRTSESDDSNVSSDASDSGSEQDANHDASPLHDDLPLHKLLRWPAMSDSKLWETFGSDCKGWPRRATDARVVKFVLENFYDPLKFAYDPFQGLRTESGIAIRNRIDLARFCNESADQDSYPG